MTILVRPSEDADVIEVTPAMVDSWRSIGAATDDAMVSALAPGKFATIEMVGKSTAGSAATPSKRYANAPKTMNVAVTRVVKTGRRMQSSEMPMVQDPAFAWRAAT